MMNAILQETLFNQNDLSDYTRQYPRLVSEIVEKINKDQFLATSEDDLVLHIVESLQIDPLIVYEDNMTCDQQETKIDVSHDSRYASRGNGPCLIPGLRLTLFLPFTGDKRLFSMSSTSCCLSPLPRGSVITSGANQGFLNMVFEFPSNSDPEEIKRSIDVYLGYLRACIKAQKTSVDSFNAALPAAAKQAVQSRCNRLEKHGKMLGVLNIPIHSRPGALTVFPIQVNKRIVTPLPPPPIGGFQAEPGVTDEVFENILSVIRHEGRSYETAPKTYSVHGEEELRDILLAHLNGYFKGAATGETFRKAGKTDVRIEDSNRAAFVAECKIWHGPKQLIDAIDQLLGYLTWRDCKAAIVLYNKNNRQFSDIQARIPEVFKSHSRFVKQESQDQSGEWRFALRAQNDDARLIHCHVFVFDMFMTGEK